MYELYERQIFPCGCEACNVPRDESGKLITLIVFCNPKCEFDGKFVGLDRGFVKYVGSDERNKYYALHNL